MMLLELLRCWYGPLDAGRVIKTLIGSFHVLYARSPRVDPDHCYGKDMSYYYSAPAVLTPGRAQVKDVVIVFVSTYWYVVMIVTCI